MSDVELPAEPETSNPFAGLTDEQKRNLTSAQVKELCDNYEPTPGQRARWAAQKAVDKLYFEVPSLRTDIVATPSELARRRQKNKFCAAWCMINSWLSELSEEGQTSIVLYTELTRLIEAAHELGKYAAPDGTKARAQKTEKARARDQKIFFAVKHYLIANPQIRRRVSQKCAREIQSAVEEIYGGRVSLSKLVEALQNFCKRRSSS